VFSGKSRVLRLSQDSPPCACLPILTQPFTRPHPPTPTPTLTRTSSPTCTPRTHTRTNTWTRTSTQRGRRDETPTECSGKTQRTPPRPDCDPSPPPLTDTGPEEGYRLAGKTFRNEYACAPAVDRPVSVENTCAPPPTGTSVQICTKRSVPLAKSSSAWSAAC